MIVEMGQMNFTVKDSNARMELSNVNLVIVSLLISAVMEIATVVTCPMRLTVHQDSPAVVTVPKQGSNATTTSVFLTLMSAMDQMTVGIILMKHLACAQI